jgi:hypothetical protein
VTARDRGVWIGFNDADGGVPERPNGAVLKTVEGQPSVGSNPTPAASSRATTEERDGGILGEPALIERRPRHPVHTRTSFALGS